MLTTMRTHQLARSTRRPADPDPPTHPRSKITCIGRCGKHTSKEQVDGIQRKQVAWSGSSCRKYRSCEHMFQPSVCAHSPIVSKSKWPEQTGGWCYKGKVVCLIMSGKKQVNWKQSKNIFRHLLLQRNVYKNNGRKSKCFCTDSKHVCQTEFGVRGCKPISDGVARRWRNKVSRWSGATGST